MSSPSDLSPPPSSCSAACPPLETGEVHVWVARLERNTRPERRGILGAILSAYPTLVEVNSSSSGELAAFAVARGRRVGVDVERVRAVRDPLELARSVLSEDDRTMLAGMPEGRRYRTFLERWTQTEAQLKARGTGLAGLGETPSAEETWSVRTLVLGSEYVGAVAAEGVGWTLRCLQW